MISKIRKALSAWWSSPEPVILGSLGPFQVDFVLGIERRPELRVKPCFDMRHDPEYPPTVAVLPAELLAKVTVTGRAGFRQMRAVTYFIDGVKQPVQSDHKFPGLELEVFLDSEDQQTVIGQIESKLDRVCREAIKALLALEMEHSGGKRIASMFLARGRRSALAAEESAFASFLEDQPLYALHEPDEEYVSVNQLQQARKLLLISYDTPRPGSLPPGSLCLSYSDEVRQLLQSYALNYEIVDKHLDSQPEAAPMLVSEGFRKMARRLSCLSADLRREGIEFPDLSSKGDMLMAINLERRTVGGTEAITGERVELSFASLKDVIIDMHEEWGDTKIRRYFYLMISDGRNHLVFDEYIPQYFESLREVNEEQALNESLLHAIPAALEFERPTLACPHLVSRQPLLELVKKARYKR